MSNQWGLERTSYRFGSERLPPLRALQNVALSMTDVRPADADALWAVAKLHEPFPELDEESFAVLK